MMGCCQNWWHLLKVSEGFFGLLLRRIMCNLYKACKISTRERWQQLSCRWTSNGFDFVFSASSTQAIWVEWSSEWIAGRGYASDVWITSIIVYYRACMKSVSNLAFLFSRKETKMDVFSSKMGNYVVKICNYE